jgi:hypothetical protein
MIKMYQISKSKYLVGRISSEDMTLRIFKLNLLIIIIKLWMSAKVNNKLILGKSVFSTREHTFFDSQFLTYKSYENQIDHNIKIILHKYQHLDIKKVRQLLEELDNQLELVIEILEEEIARSLPIVEEAT